MTIENKPLTRLQDQVTNSQAVISDLGTIKSKISTLQTALSTFEDPSTYNNPTVSSSDSSVVTATASSTAAIGSIKVAVTQVASPSQLILRKYAGTNFSSASDLVSFDSTTGFKLTVGTTVYSTKNASTPIQGTGPGGATSVSDLKNWINSLGANVSAAVLQTTSSSDWVLQISGTKSGEANAVSVDTGASGSGSAISNLIFPISPSQSFTAAGATGGVMTVALAGGSGSGATANVSYDTLGNVTGVELQNAGSGYKAGDALTISSSSSNTDANKTSFSALAAGKTVILDGLTFTAGANGATAAQVAKAFANIGGGTSYASINTSNGLTGTSTGGLFTAGTSTVGLSSGLVNGSNGDAIVFNGPGYVANSGTGVVSNTTTSAVVTKALTSIVAGGEPYYDSAISTAAKDAIANINGLTVQRSSNTISDVVSGITLNLAGPSATSTTFSTVMVNQGADNSSGMINTLMLAYNDVINTYNSMTANANNSSTPGNFANDPTMLSFVNNIKSMFAYGATDASAAKITGFASASDPMSMHVDSVNSVVDGYLQVGSTKYKFSSIPTQAGVAPTVSQFITWANGLGAGITATFDGSAISISGSKANSGIAVDFSGLNNAITRSTTSLAGMGMDLQLDGTIQFNTATYQTAVTNGLYNKLASGLKLGFSSSTSNLDTFIKSEIDPSSGALVSQIAAQQTSILDLQKRETDLQTRLNSIQQSYITQYSALNALLFQLNSTSTSLASALAAVTNINAGK